MSDDASGPFLPWIIAILVYLAALALAGGLLANAFVDNWQRSLSGALTVQVPPGAPGADEEARAERLGALVEALEARADVLLARRMTAEEMAALLEPWLGRMATAEDLPLPDLIAVTLAPGARPDLERLAAELRSLAPGALVDDHQRWLADLARIVRSLQAIAALVVVLVGLSAVVAVVFLTRTGLAVHQPVIELLHLIGAQDAYVAGQFQAHALRLALRGSLIGFGLAALTILGFGVWLGASGGGVMPVLSLSPLAWAGLLALPLAAVLVAMATARITVLRDLARLP